MTRPLRIEYEDAVYHVMNRGLAGGDIFTDEQDYQNFIKVIKEANQHWKINVYAYCLMKNHYHLCFQTPEGNLSRVMRHIDGVYTQRFNRVHHRDGPIFRGRYKAIIIDAEEYLGEVVRYIHLNPVKEKWVENPTQYLWSSYREYLSRTRGSHWLKTERLLGSFEGSAGFNAYVMAGNSEEVERFYGKKKQAIILGGDKFIKRIKDEGGEPHQEHVREEGQYLRPSVKQVIKAIESVYKVQSDDIERGKRGVKNEARQLAIFLAYEECDLKYKEIAERFNLRSYGTVGWVCTKMRERLQSDNGLMGRLNKIRGLLK